MNTPRSAAAVHGVGAVAHQHRYHHSSAAAASSSSYRPRSSASAGGVGGAAGGAGGGGGSSSGAAAASATGELRLGQLLEDEDHRRCAAGGRRDLLAERLDALRGLVREIRDDDWMFEIRDSAGSGGGGGGGGDATVLTSSSEHW